MDCRGSAWIRVAQQKPRPICRCLSVERVGRGCAEYALHYNRDPGFFVLAIEKVFEFRPDWHQDERASPLVRQYRTTLESILESQPRLRVYLTRCAHCGIEFLTDPRNAGRTDLRCPFGCRRHHCRQRSGDRSTAYYRTGAGRFKKKRLNARRGAGVVRCEQVANSGPATPVRPDAAAVPVTAAERDTPTAAVTPPPPVTPTAADTPATAERSAEPEFELRVGDVVLTRSSLSRSGLLPYVGLLVRLIEGLELSRRELLEFLERSLRQRRMVSRGRRDYVLAFLHQHPP